MKAIKSQIRMKQLTVLSSMLLFLFSYVDLSAQENPNSLFSLVSTQAAADLVKSSPVTSGANVVISFSFPIPMQVALTVYDEAGREIKTLANSLQNPGSHSFDLKAAGLKKGVYYYMLTIGTYTEVKKVVLKK